MVNNQPFFMSNFCYNILKIFKLQTIRLWKPSFERVITTNRFLEDSKVSFRAIYWVVFALL